MSSWCSLVGCIFAGIGHPTAGPFPCGAMGCLCGLRAVMVEELNVSAGWLVSEQICAGQRGDIKC